MKTKSSDGQIQPPFTRIASVPHSSSCECDDEFRDCLEAADSKKSDSIGWWFFITVSNKCLANDFMQRDPTCVEWGYGQFNLGMIRTTNFYL